jgi:parallel beta-helix repeat protein
MNNINNKCIALKMIFILALYISLLLIQIPSSGQSSDLKEKTCIDYYTFENDSLTPRFIVNDGWQRSSDKPYTGSKSLRSQLSARKICRLSMEVEGQKDISFWWYSDIVPGAGNNSRLLFRLDNEPNFIEYGGSGWKKVEYHTSGENSKILNWIFYSGSNEAKSFIDNLCIKSIYCDSECSNESTSLGQYSLGSLVNDTLVENNVDLSSHSVKENKTNITFIENIYSPDEIFNNVTPVNATTEIYYVINGCNQSPYIFPSIQEAIDAVPSCSTICIIGNGDQFVETLTINKPLNLEGKNAIVNTLDSEIGCKIKSSGVAINGIKFIGGRIGLWIENTDGGNISNNRFEDNQIGILLYYTENITLYNNTLKDHSRDAIRLVLSINNNIKNNSIIDANAYGINLDRSDLNTITGNDLKDTYEDSIFLNNSDKNTIINNVYSGRRDCAIFSSMSNGNIIDIGNEVAIRCIDSSFGCKCYKRQG